MPGLKVSTIFGICDGGNPVGKYDVTANNPCKMCEKCKKEIVHECELDGLNLEDDEDYEGNPRTVTFKNSQQPPTPKPNNPIAPNYPTTRRRKLARKLPTWMQPEQSQQITTHNTQIKC